MAKVIIGSKGIDNSKTVRAVLGPNLNDDGVETASILEVEFREELPTKYPPASDGTFYEVHEGKFKAPDGTYKTAIIAKGTELDTSKKYRIQKTSRKGYPGYQHVG